MDLIQEQQDRVVQALEQIFKKMNKGMELRKLKSQELRCQANCYENEQLSISQVEQCGGDCAISLAHFMNFVNKEYSGVVERTNRCAQGCLDLERDKMSAKNNESQNISFSKEFHSCVTRCIDDCLNVHIPRTNKQVERELSAVKIPK